jgi:hypothetical protein
LKLGVYILWAVIASIVGLFVLLGYFVTSPLLLEFRQLFMQWAVLLAAAAIFMGLINLFIVHWNKVNDQTAGWPYSAILIFFLLVSLALGLIFGPDFEVMFLLFNYIQLPVEGALMALLAVSLVVAGFRIVSHRRDIFSVLFVVTAVLVLLGNSPWLMGSDSTVAHLIGNVRAWVSQVWSAGGARGILIGVALGAVATGLRVLMGTERPYGD